MRNSLSILAACCFAAAVTVSSDTEAAQVSLCKVTLYPQSGTRGNVGHIRVSTFNGTCDATIYWFCSTGATHSFCDTNYLYREQALMSLYEKLVDAELLGVPVDIISESTGMAGNRRGQIVNFLD